MSFALARDVISVSDWKHMESRYMARRKAEYGRAWYALRGALRGDGFRFKVKDVRAAMQAYERAECMRREQEHD